MALLALQIKHAKLRKKKMVLSNGFKYHDVEYFQNDTVIALKEYHIIKNNKPTVLLYTNVFNFSQLFSDMKNKT